MLKSRSSVLIGIGGVESRSVHDKNTSCVVSMKRYPRCEFTQCYVYEFLRQNVIFAKIRSWERPKKSMKSWTWGTRRNRATMSKQQDLDVATRAGRLQRDQGRIENVTVQRRVYIRKLWSSFYLSKAGQRGCVLQFNRPKKDSRFNWSTPVGPGHLPGAHRPVLVSVSSQAKFPAHSNPAHWTKTHFDLMLLCCCYYLAS